MISNKRLYRYLFIITFLLSACEKSVVLNIDDFIPDEIVNCILTPDSIIKVDLSFSDKVNFTGEYLPINNARVWLTDSTGEHQLDFVSRGKYQLNSKPSPLNTYALKIITEENVELKSSTLIPGMPNVVIKSDSEVGEYVIKLEDNPESKDYYWVSVQNYDSFFNHFEQERVIYTNFKTGDEFNRVDSDYYSGMNYLHAFYIRIDDEFMQGESIEFKIRFDKSFYLKDRILIINADPNLDKYMKSALIQYDHKNLGDAPIFYIPMNMYSNIENGKGIFGSCSISSHEFDYNTSMQ